MKQNYIIKSSKTIETHLILSESAGFIREHIVDHSFETEDSWAMSLLRDKQSSVRA